MKKPIRWLKISCTILVLGVLSDISAIAGPFAPPVLHLSAPAWVMYNFDNHELRLPFTVSGTPATVSLLFFTYTPWYKNAKVSWLRNGYMGWHYVDQLDTCVYISAPMQCTPGENIATWDGKSSLGNPVDRQMLTYYLWGYDASSKGELVTRQIRLYSDDRSVIQMYDSQGMAIANPWLYDAGRVFPDGEKTTRMVRSRWIIGGDPDDATLLETTAYSTWSEHSQVAPEYPSSFFVQSLKSDGALVLRKFAWVPNGDAELQEHWGDNGAFYRQTSLRPESAAYSGPVEGGKGLLWCTDISSDGLHSGVIAVDALTGALIKERDLTEWWADTPGGPVSGPSNLTFRNNLLYCSSPFSCLVQVINPSVEDRYDMIKWINGNGDFIGDKNYSPDSPHPWRCNDPEAAPFIWNLGTDEFGFTAFQSAGLNNTTFGLFAPDGTGVGYFAIAGESDEDIQGFHSVNYGSAFDGFFYGSAREDSAGVWHIASDSVKGIISDGSEEWMEPTWVHIVSPKSNDCWDSGSIQTIFWSSMFVGAIRIEYSPDNGATWQTVVGSVNAFKGRYRWTIPSVQSTQCMIRISDSNNPSVYAISDGIFTISGPTGVSDLGDAAPRPFITASNHPNPFNPSTTIHYILGISGTVTITVYNTVGQQVMRRSLGRMDRGAHEFIFDGAELTSGLYFYRLATENAATTGKMLLVR